MNSWTGPLNRGLPEQAFSFSRSRKLLSVARDEDYLTDSV